MNQMAENQVNYQYQGNRNQHNSNGFKRLMDQLRYTSDLDEEFLEFAFGPNASNINSNNVEPSYLNREHFDNGLNNAPLFQNSGFRNIVRESNSESNALKIDHAPGEIQLLEVSRAAVGPTRVRQDRHICPVCGKAFPHKYNLENHYIVHAYKPFVCNVCGESFVRESNCKKHMGFHKEITQASCTNKPSPEEFAQQSYSNQDGHICPVCGEIFPNKSLLDLHSEGHFEGIKSYVCKICHKEYARKDSLTKHELLHN